MEAADGAECGGERGGAGGAGSAADADGAHAEVLRGARCRHRALSAYFGQEYGEGECGACDVCLRELDEIPGSTEIARKILSCVARVREGFGAAYIIDVLRGRSTQKTVERRHNELSTFGILATMEKAEIANCINQMLDAGVLARDGGEFPVLRLNAAGVELMKGQREVAFFEAKRAIDDRARARSAAAAGEAPLSVEEGALFESLRGLRRRIAEELNVPPYVVFGDATLEEMARVRPGSVESFISLRGVGQVKASQFGERFVAHVREHCEARGMALDAMAGSRPRRVRERKPPVRRRGVSRELFKAGKSVEEVAERLELAPRTAFAHLADYILQEKPASIERWVDAETYGAVAAAAGEVGTALLRPIFDRLEGKIGYEQIRLVVNHMDVMGEERK